MIVYQTLVKIMVYVQMALTLLHVNVSQGLLEQIVKQVRSDMFWIMVLSKSFFHCQLLR